MPDFIAFGPGMTRLDVKALYTEHEKFWLETPKRAKFARDITQGKIVPDLPEEFKPPERDSFKIRMSQQTTMPLQLANMLQERRPRLRRFSSGESIAAQEASTLIERWVNAAVLQLVDTDAIYDLLLNEGCAAVLTQPSPTAWAQIPDFLLDDDKTVHPRYRRDKEGNPPPPDAKGFRLNRKASAKAYRAERASWMAERLPLRHRVIGPQEFVPIYGPGMELDGIIVKSEYSRSQLLKRKFLWDEGGHATPTHKGTANTMTLYEAWITDDEGTPWLVYSVDGHATTMRTSDGQVDAAINLRKEWGMTRLPVAIGWGWHWSEREPDHRAIPFPWVFGSEWLMISQLATSLNAHTFLTSFGGWFVKPDPDMPGVADFWADMDNPQRWSIPPLTITPVPGQMIPATHPGANHNVGAILSLLQEDVDANAGGGEATVGGGQLSGFSRRVASDQLRATLTQILEGCRELVQRSAEDILSCADYIAGAFSPVPVYHVGPRVGAGTPTKLILELSAGVIGDTARLDCYYQKRPGEDIPKGQLWADWHDRGLVLTREFREEIMADEAPEEFLAALMVQNYYRSDQASADVLELVAKKAGDEKMAERMRLVRDGKMTEQGTPAAMAAGLAPQGDMGLQPVPSGQVPAGTTMPYIPGSMVGGIVSGATQQAAESAAQSAALAGGPTGA